MSRKKGKKSDDNDDRPFWETITPAEIWQLAAQEERENRRNSPIIDPGFTRQWSNVRPSTAKEPTLDELLARVIEPTVGSAGDAKAIAERQRQVNMRLEQERQNLLVQTAGLREWQLNAQREEEMRKKEQAASMRKAAEEQEARLRARKAEEQKLLAVSIEEKARLQKELLLLQEAGVKPCKRLGPLTNPSNAAGTSCFADSVLTALLAPDNAAVRKAFLGKGPEDLLICDLEVNERAIREQLVQAVRNYNQLIHSDPLLAKAKSEICLDIRRLIALCKTQFQDLGPNQQGKYNVADSSEFWTGLSEIFQFEPTLIEESDVNFSDGRPAKTNIRQVASVRLSPPAGDSAIVTAKQVEKRETDSGLSFETINRIVSAVFIAVDIPRYEYDMQGRKFWLRKQFIVPDDRMTLDRMPGEPEAEQFELQSFVAWSGGERLANKTAINVGHYVSYVRCDKDNWLLFDDLRGPEPIALSVPPTAQLQYGSVLLFFRKSN